jgi:Pentapeptide repeats (8 copies)
MDPTVESAWIAAAAAIVGVVGTATVGIVGYFIARSTNRDALAQAKKTTDETIAAAHADVARTLESTREGQITDLYSRAIDQLGSAQLHVRIGGIYALGRIARDSEEHRPIAMEVLTAFIRENSQERWPPADRHEEGRWTRPDIQAAVNVVGRLNVGLSLQPIDLYRAVLINANLNDLDLRGAALRGANLTGAYLYDTKLVDADLRDVAFDGVHLHSADLTRRADLTGAKWSSNESAPQGWQLHTGPDGLHRLERQEAVASGS